MPSDESTRKPALAEGSGRQPSLIVIAALREQLKVMQAQDPFEVLGIPRSVERDDVRRAFGMQTSRWDAARFASQPANVRDCAAAIRMVIERAFDQLADPVRFAVLSGAKRRRSRGEYHQHSERGVAFARMDSEPPFDV